MSPSKRQWRELWALPAVLAICALMVVPASALLQSPAAAHGGSVLGPTAVPTSHGSPIVAPSSARASQTPSGTSTPAASGYGSALDRSATTLQASGGNPATVSMLQDVAAALQSGAVSPFATRLPSNILSSAKATDPIDALTNQGPSSMGISDLGLNNSSTTHELNRYLLNESAVRGNATLTSYNASSGSFYEASSPLFQNNTTANSPGSPYDSGLQLNTVLSNVTYPLSGGTTYNVGSFWTQNVLLFVGNHLQLLDNIWNMSGTSSPTTTLKMGTLWSYNGVHGYKGILLPQAEGGFYYDYGPKIPLAYPISIQLTNNATVNATTGRDMVLFQYSIKEAAKTYTGTYDTVIFNSPVNSTKPWKAFHGAGDPVFRIDGLQGGVTPGGAFYDSEFVFCGPGAGSNSVVNSASGTLSLAYSNATVPNWHAPPSAYDYGVDTGESVIGLAETWATNHTASVAGGPSLLYGLWGAPTVATPAGPTVPFALPAEQAAVGAFEFSSTASPGYAFTFIGWGTAATPTWATTLHPAYAPSNAAGIVTTFLPPSLPSTTAPGSVAVTNYGVEGFADGYQALNSTITFGKTNQLSYKVTLTARTSGCHPCFINPAPIYINGPAQASAIVTDLGVSSAKVPTLENLYLSLDPVVGSPGPVAATFDLLNDFDYSTFSLVSIVNLTTEIVVYNVVQGGNNGGTRIYFGYPTGESFLGISFYANTTGNPKPDQQYVDYGGANDVFSNLTLRCWGVEGGCAAGAISLWDTTGVSVLNTTTEYGPGAIWASTTAGTSVKQVVGVDGTALTLLDSTGALGFNVSGVDDGTAVNDSGSTGASFTYLNASGGGVGLSGFWGNGTTVKDVRANGDALGTATDGGIGLTVTNVWANNSACGVCAYLASKTTITNGSAWNYSTLVDLVNGSAATIANQYLNRSLGDAFVDTFATATVTDTTATNESTAAVVEDATGITFTTVSVNRSNGVYVNDTLNAAVSVTGVTASLDSTGVRVYYATGVTVTTVTVKNESTGVYVYGQSGDVTVSGVTASIYSVGVNVSGDGPNYMTDDVSISGVTATGASVGAFVDWATATTISSVTVSNETIGVLVYDTIATTITGVTATNKTLGNLFMPYYYGLYGPYAAIDSSENAELKASDITATTYPAALFDDGSSGMQVSSVTASHGQFAIVLNDTYNSFFTGVNAPNDWQGMSLSDDAYDNTITNSQFTNDTSYGVAMLFDADGNVVYGSEFVNDNGATGTYNAGHIQASAGEYNYFYICTNSACTTGEGNYWSDWHAQNPNGSLKPYVVAGGAVDEFPTTVTTTPSSMGSEYAVVAIAMALIAVFVAVTTVLAMRMRKGGKSASSPPVAWTSPSGGTGGSGGQAGPSTNTWSEGTGGKPPAS